MRSSKKLYDRLTQLKAYQNYVTPFIEKRMTKKEKQRMFIMMGLVFLLSGILVSSTLVRLILALVYISLVFGLSYYLKDRKTIQVNPEKKSL